MCGIAGILTYPDTLDDSLSRQRNLQILNNMVAELTHRGPDDKGVWCDGKDIVLGFRRLSIQDLSVSGHQPMTSACGRYTMIFNGEVYNFNELRKQLNQFEYKGHSDTEVILNAITHWGIEKALTQFNGMFAIALWDNKTRQLTLARDKIGKKPLYYAQIGKQLVFASELKAFNKVPTFEGTIDRQALTLYLRYNYIPAPYSIFEGVYKLPAGSYMTIQSEELVNGVDFDEKITNYWSAINQAYDQFSTPYQGSENEALNTLDDLLNDATRMRMVADVPFGVLLSGGIDSSTIAAIMQRNSDTPINSFSIGFQNSKKDEAPLSKKIAKYLGTVHHEYYVSAKEALDVIPHIPQIYDEPFADSSQIPTFLVSKMAKENVTVALSGDGGDELFYGYNRYFRNAKNWQRKQHVPRFLTKAMAAFLKLSVNSQKIESIKNKRISDLSAEHCLDMYHNRISKWTAPEKLIIGANPEQMPQLAKLKSLDIESVENNMMLLDFVSYLSDDILVKVDRASMANSLEMRNPILDSRIVELAWSLPQSFKFKNNKGKHILREVLNRYVPQSLTDNPKMGFGSPIRDWLMGPLSEWAEELLDKNRLTQEGIFNPDQVREIWHQFKFNNKKYHTHIWTILMFQAWYEHYKNTKNQSD